MEGLPRDSELASSGRGRTQIKQTGRNAVLAELVIFFW